MKRLFVCSFAQLLAALAQDIVRLGHLENAFFFFPLHPKGYFLNEREVEPGPFFDDGRQQVHLERFREIIPFLLNAKKEGRAWYSDHGAVAIDEWLSRIGYTRIVNNKRNFSAIVDHMKALMNQGKIAIVGGGVSFSALSEALNKWENELN